MNVRRAYLDACVAIYYVERHPTLCPRVEAALFHATGDNTVPVFSDLTRMECRVLPLRQQDQRLLARYDAFFGLPDCGYAPMSGTVFDLATEVRAQHGLQTPDALHLAAAILSGCDELWTRDMRLARAAAGRIALVVFDETR